MTMGDQVFLLDPPPHGALGNLQVLCDLQDGEKFGTDESNRSHEDLSEWLRRERRW